MGSWASSPWRASSRWLTLPRWAPWGPFAMEPTEFSHTIAGFRAWSSLSVKAIRPPPPPCAVAWGSLSPSLLRRRISFCFPGAPCPIIVGPRKSMTRPSHWRPPVFAFDFTPPPENANPTSRVTSQPLPPPPPPPQLPAPSFAALPPAAIPEPTIWAMMVLGFGLVAAAVRFGEPAGAAATLRCANARGRAWASRSKAWGQV